MKLKYIKGKLSYMTIFEFDSVVKNSSIEWNLNEMWKEVGNYPDYAVSDYGRCWSKKTHKMLKPQGKPYKRVRLYNDEGGKDKYIHRLVASAFKENPKGLKYVCHINSRPSDNRAENLKWGTAKFNNGDIHRRKKLSDSLQGHEVTKHTRKLISKARGTQVYQCDYKGRILRKWRSMSYAAKRTGVNAANISKCCRGLRQNAGGYCWKYVNEIVDFMNVA